MSDTNRGSGELSERLKQSEYNRSHMIKSFGCVPLSILKLSRGALSQSMHSYQHEANTKTNIMNNPGRKEKERKLAAAGYEGKGNPSMAKAGRGSEGLSMMPAELVEFFCKYYGAPGQTYIDPFMGQGIRMQVAHRLGMHYYGYDLSPDFFHYVEAVKRTIDDGTTTLQVTFGDSKQPDKIPDDIGDFSFHSPPYWDIEDYGDHPEQLGRGKTYREFLNGMRAVAAAWLPKFKQGAWHIVNVNDFRKDGKFYSYHSDLIAEFVAAGWTLHDMWIIDGLVGGMSKAFAVDFNMKRIAPKVHEFAIVFQKA